MTNRTDDQAGGPARQDPAAAGPPSHDELHRAVLERAGWTDLEEYPFRGLCGVPPGGGPRAFAMDLFDPRLAAQLRADLGRDFDVEFRHCQHPEPRKNWISTWALAAISFNVIVDATEEPDPIRRECLATARLYLQARACP